MNRMLFVRLKEFSFRLFVKVYRYPVGTRKFHGISVDHKRFGILVYLDGETADDKHIHRLSKLPLVNGSFLRT